MSPPSPLLPSLPPSSAPGLDTLPSPAKQKKEGLKCTKSFAYFVWTYVKIYDVPRKAWIPFKLWAAQFGVLTDLGLWRLIVILKARQLGMTWLVLAWFLWNMLYRPIASVMLFSLRETEAKDLLKRMKQMHEKLPPYIQARSSSTNAKLEWVMSTGSVARAFPSKTGDSYQATHVLVDEADLVPDLDDLIERVEPTLGLTGQLILLSRSNQKLPQSPFKAVYRAAKKKANDYHAIFLAWFAHPERDADWLESKKRDAMSRKGSLDPVHAQYPATDAEAMAAATQDKRIPPAWLNHPEVYKQRTPIEAKGAPALPLLRIYKAPVKGRQYRLGVDPAEGLPGGDDSTIAVTDKETGEFVCHLAAKLGPKVELPLAVALLSIYYNNAPALIERNNHGHAVIGALENWSNASVPFVRSMILKGPDKRPGWVQTPANKAELYNDMTECVRAKAVTIYDFSAHQQLGAIDRDTLAHPNKKKGAKGVDDEAMACVLANKARSMGEWRPLIGWD